MSVMKKRRRRACCEVFLYLVFPLSQLHTHRDACPWFRSDEVSVELCWRRHTSVVVHFLFSASPCTEPSPVRFELLDTRRPQAMCTSPRTFRIRIEFYKPQEKGKVCGLYILRQTLVTSLESILVRILARDIRSPNLGSA